MGDGGSACSFLISDPALSHCVTAIFLIKMRNSASALSSRLSCRQLLFLAEAQLWQQGCGITKLANISLDTLSPKIESGVNLRVHSCPVVWGGRRCERAFNRTRKRTKVEKCKIKSLCCICIIIATPEAKSAPKICKRLPNRALISTSQRALPVTYWPEVWLLDARGRTVVRHFGN